MNRWAIYRPNGAIDRIYGGTAEEAVLQPQGDEAVVEILPSLTDDTAYVDAGIVKAKAPFAFIINKTQILADGLDECVISNVPAGTTVRWPDGQTDTVTDGEVRLSVDLPGTYTLRFSAVPYLDQEVTLEAVAAA